MNEPSTEYFYEWQTRFCQIRRETSSASQSCHMVAGPTDDIASARGMSRELRVCRWLSFKHELCWHSGVVMLFICFEWICCFS